ncbi:uncharacterized protein [Miscanthus floridulus]|uniref:uncharacterized protein n=1 Tax=Miscanthus floridulus TaxID=154761 RepID=UPI003457F1BC
MLTREEILVSKLETVYLKVSPLRGTVRFHVKGKLAPRFIGPYKILKKIGKLAYKLELPPNLAGVHHVFHISQLRKCLRVPEEQVHTEALDLQYTLEYLEHPMKILDQAVKETRRTTIPFCKVPWSNHAEREATWEKEEELRKQHPTSSPTEYHLNLEDEITVMGKDYNIP